MLKEIHTRTVLRITLIRDYNTDASMIPAFAQMLDGASPHFVEIKSYMHIGRSTNRLERNNMLEMDEVREFSQGVTRSSRLFRIEDESPISRITLLQNVRRHVERIIPAYA